MNSTMVGLIVFACTFGGAPLGMRLRKAFTGHLFSNESKDTVKVGVEARTEMIWSQDASKRTDLDPIRSGAVSAAEGLPGTIRALKPRDDSQQALQSRALDLAEEMLKERWLVLAGSQTSIPVPFLVILLFWLTLTFASFGLFAPQNGVVIWVLFLCALSIGGAVFLILELDTPFEGVIRVSADPLRYAYSHLNQ